MSLCDYFFVATWKVRKDLRKTVYSPCWVHFILLIISATYFGLDYVSYSHAGRVPAGPDLTNYTDRWSVYLDTYCTSGSPSLTHEPRKFGIDFETCQQQCWDSATCKVLTYGVWTGAGEHSGAPVCQFYERCAAKKWNGMKIYARSEEELLAPVPDLDIRMLAPVPLNFIAMGAKPLVGVCSVVVSAWAAFVAMRYSSSLDVIHSLQIALGVANAVFLFVMLFKLGERLMNAVEQKEASSGSKVAPATYVPPQVQAQAPITIQQPASGKPTTYATLPAADKPITYATQAANTPGYSLIDFADPTPGPAPQKKPAYEPAAKKPPYSLGGFDTPAVPENKPAPVAPSYAFSGVQKEPAAPSAGPASQPAAPPSYTFSDLLEEPQPAPNPGLSPPTEKVQYHSSAQSEPAKGSVTWGSSPAATLKHGNTSSAVGGYVLDDFLEEEQDSRSKTTPAPPAPVEQDGKFIFDLSAFRMDSSDQHSGSSTK